MKVIRPGALVDYRDFEPPGRLGKRLGNIFVAVGSPSDRLGVVDVGFAGRFLGWMTDAWDQVTSPLNLLDPVSPTKQELLNRLRRANPDLSVFWLPRAVLVPLSWLATLAQKPCARGSRPSMWRRYSVCSHTTLPVLPSLLPSSTRTALSDSREAV